MPARSYRCFSREKQYVVISIPLRDKDYVKHVCVLQKCLTIEAQMVFNNTGTILAKGVPRANFDKKGHVLKNDGPKRELRSDA